jgi:hypothetical protein
MTAGLGPDGRSGVHYSPRNFEKLSGIMEM